MKHFKLLILFIFTATFQIIQAQEASQEKLESIVSELASDSYLGRGFGTMQGEKAATAIAAAFQEAGIQPLLEDYYQTFSKRIGILNIDGRNVIGVIEGSNEVLKNEYIILGAHYDHVGWKIVNNDTVVYNGADDNASGVAGVIEIGRVLMENREALGRSVILVAFDGEESGLLGSNAFVDDLILGPAARINQSSVAGMFSLDMIGMYEAHGGVDLLGMEQFLEWEAILQFSKEKVGIDISKTSGGIPNRTDTEPFGNAGIPSVHVFTGTESPYHKPEDDSDLLDYNGMKRITDFVTAMTLEISNLEEVKRTKKMDELSEGGEKDKIFLPGISINAGNSHFDYKDAFFKAKGVFAYGAGLTLETRINSWLAIKPEVLYEWGGSQTNAGNLRTHALTLPFNFLLLTPDQSGMGVRVYYQAGAYYRYIFAGKDPTGALDLVNNYNNTDYGIIYGFGFQIMDYRIGFDISNSLVDFSLSDAPNLDTRHVITKFKIGKVF